MFGRLASVSPVSSRTKLPRFRRVEMIFLGMTAAILVAVAIFGPTFPMIDSAFFEFVGRSIARGRHLYVDLWDNKLPSIYLVNAVYWMIFGGHFRLHLIAETSVAALTIALFATLARKLEIVHWAALTLVYALFHLFAGGPPNQTEQYATPLILAGVLFAVHGRPILAAIALVLASTFWVPSIVPAGIALMVGFSRAQRVTFAVAAIVAGIAVLVAFVSYYGVPTSAELFQSWVSYEVGNYKHSNFHPEQHTYAAAPLSPSFYTRGLGALLAIAATFWARAMPPHRARRLALVWSSVTLLIVASLGKVSPHYFIPMYPPFLLVIGTLSFSTAAAVRRWYVAVPAIALCLVTVKYATDINRPDLPTIAAIRYTGAAILASYGPGTIAILPWEMYLPSDAFPPGRFFLARVVKFAEEHDRWAVPPDVYVDARDEHFNRLPPPSDLHLLCQNDRTGAFLVYSRHAISALTCVPVREKKAATTDRHGLHSRIASAKS